MRKELLHDAERYISQNKRRRVWRRIVRVMACIVVFCTTYALILPAITMEKYSCGAEEHTHGESCYEKVESQTISMLACTYESMGIHSHALDCYDSEANLLCGQADFLVHTHDGSCVDALGVVVCRIPEITEHAHTDSCYETEEAESAHEHEDACYTTERGDLICQTAETDGHIHGDACFTRGKLLCALTEEEDHSHGTDCYEWLLTCELSEEEGHLHTDSCYELVSELICQLEDGAGDASGSEEPVLICEKEVIRLHSHDDELCYETYQDENGNEQKRLICEELEIREHIHNESCFVTEVVEAEDPDTLTCTETDETHEHTDRCYGTWKLICGKEEHTHNLVCQNDPEADVETEADWIATFADVTLTGEWDEDLLAIARSQLGYQESTRNYEVMEDGETIKGYTRYGDWYGMPYGDWCAMFVSFCLNYAEIPQDAIPYEANCPDWIEALQDTDYDLYRPAGKYTPVPGDLIFFDWEEDGISDHVGIVAEIIPETEEEPAKIKTIEGNIDDQVAEQEYSPDDCTILGYGQLPPTRYCGMEKHSHTADCMDDLGNLICTRNEHIHSDSCLTKIRYFCGKEEHTHGAECLDAEGNLICGVEEHTHFILCTDPETYICCWLTEHTHDESCLDEHGSLICGLDIHTHTADCCDYIGSLIVMIDALPSSEEAEEILLAYEETEDWDGYAAYQQKVSNLAWQLYYACEELDEEELLLVTNYDRLMDLCWLWGATTYALPGKSPYYPMDNGEWLTDLSADNPFYDYVHVNEVVPDEYTVDGLVLGAKLTAACETSFTPVFTSSLAGLTDEECIALTGYSWNAMDSAGLDNTYGANIILSANDTEHDALIDGKKIFVVYRNVGTYRGKTIHVLVQIVNYKPFEDDKGVVHNGILGFYSNGYIGVAACGVEWVKLQYNFIEDKDIAAAIECAKKGDSLSGYRISVKGSTSFYDIDYSQAIHMHGTENTPWTELLTGIYVTDVTSDVPDLNAVDALSGNTAKRDYFRNWTANDCVLKIGTVDHEYSSWTGPAIFSSHPYDAADEDWRTDSKHGVTMTFDHAWFYMNFSFDKGRNADGGIRHFGEPVSRGSLTIEKEVTGTNIGTEREFEFVITFHKQQSDGNYVADTALNGTYGGVTLVNGVGTFKLKHGESITINNIPIRQHGTHYHVTELNYDGYIVETSMSNQEMNGALVSHGPYTQDYYESSIQPDSAMAQHQIVVFTNYGGAVLPNTGGAGKHLYTMGGALLTCVAILLYIHNLKRRKEERPSF